MNFNVGIDCEEIKRWRNMLPKLQNGPAGKLFSSAEHGYCRSFRDPAPHYAARWCAIEALVKAASPFCTVDVRNVEVANDGEGRPFFIFNDQDAKLCDLSVKLSMSHTKETAMAVVMVAAGTSYG